MTEEKELQQHKTQCSTSPSLVRPVQEDSFQIALDRNSLVSGHQASFSLTEMGPKSARNRRCLNSSSTPIPVKVHEDIVQGTVQMCSATYGVCRKAVTEPLAFNATTQFRSTCVLKYHCLFSPHQNYRFSLLLCFPYSLLFLLALYNLYKSKIQSFQGAERKQSFT